MKRKVKTDMYKAMKGAGLWTRFVFAKDLDGSLTLIYFESFIMITTASSGNDDGCDNDDRDKKMM